MDILSVAFTESGNEASLKTDAGYFDVSKADLRRFLDEYACACSASFDEFCENLPLFVPDSADEELVFLAEKLKAVKYAVYLLGISDKSEKQLKLKLKTKGYSEKASLDALAVLKKNGYLSDERYCRRKCEQLAAGKLFGRRRILSELMAKGLPYALCDKVLDEAEIDFEENIRILFEKLTKGDYPQNREQKKKISDKLLRFGYSFDEISGVFDEYLPE